MSSAYVYAAVRTPFGRFGGALADTRPDDLAATAVRGVLEKTPGLDEERIGDVVWGCANQAGEDNRNVGRMAVLLAGLPVSVPATTVNRLCGSSLDAAIIGSRTIESGDADVVLTGGVESMTRAPWVLPKPSRAFPAGNVTAVSTTLGWRLVNDRMPTGAPSAAMRRAAAPSLRGDALPAVIDPVGRNAGLSPARRSRLASGRTPSSRSSPSTGTTRSS
jgi:acetyl-CoA acyltransferase